MKNLEIMGPILNLDKSIGMDERGEPVTIKTILLQYVVPFTSDDHNPKKIMRTRKLSEMIFEHNIDTLKLEDADFDLLKEMIKKGIGPQKFHHSDNILAQIYEVFEKAEKSE